MKTNYVIYLLLAICCGIIVYSCSKESDIDNFNNSIESRTVEEIDLLSRNWADGSYLHFFNIQDVQNTYSFIEEEIEDNIVTNEMLDSGIYNPVLDAWELTKNNGNFMSMRRAYDEYTRLGIVTGLNPEQIKGIPIINDALAGLISPDGLVRVGDTIQYFSDAVYASAPITLKNRLKEIVEDGEPITPDDIAEGIKLEPRSPADCDAKFDYTINHHTKEVFVNYTGSSIAGGDKSIVWSIEEGAGNHSNETSFSQTYNSVGEKQICVTYTETDIVTDTTYTYHRTYKDSTFQIPNTNKDTTVRIEVVTKVPVINTIKKIICHDTQCKTFTIGGCSADFDYTIGFDNVVSFVDKSNVNAGTITGWQWNFGDGSAPSTQQHPTHTFPCDKSFEVTLIIYSTQCDGGSHSTSRKIKVSGADCCDRNPQSSWKDKFSSLDPDNKRIRYRYDMGTNWDWLFDQDFKAKITYYQNRKGGIWPIKKKKFWPTKAQLDVDFDGKVFARDEEGCKCIETQDRILSAQPSHKQAKSYTFKDNLSASAVGTRKTHWMKDDFDVHITYKVDGETYIVQHCQSSPGFHCE